MEYDFYQRITRINKLIKVGRGFVPDNRPTWLYAVSEPITVKNSEDIFTTPVHSSAQEIMYQRRKTITGDIFVAEVDSFNH